MPKLSFLRKTSSCMASCMAVLTFTAVFGAALLSPPPALAKACSESAVAPRTVPPSLWGELQSVGVAQDATNFNGNQRADTRFPMATSIDIENGYIFLSAYFGFQIWDIRSTPEAPVKLGTADGWSGAFASWVPGSSEVDQIIRTIDAPAGDDTLAAVGGINPVGLLDLEHREQERADPALSGRSQQAGLPDLCRDDRRPCLRLRRGLRGRRRHLRL